MKKLIYIIYILIFISCKDNVANKSFESPILEVEDDVEEFQYSINSGVNTYQNLSIQKLQDYFDLIKLQEKHPEFKDDILLQIRMISNDTIPNYIGNFSIENIHQSGKVEIVSDSVQKIKLVYDVVSESYKGVDSIFAVIIFKAIQLEGVETISNKVMFSKH